MCQGILEQPNDPASQQTGDLAAARHRKKNRHQKWQIKHREKMNVQGQPCLEKQRNERNSNRHRNAEPIYLNLLAGCVSNGHAIGEEFRSVGMPQVSKASLQSSHRWSECSKPQVSSPEFRMIAFLQRLQLAGPIQWKH